MGWHRDQGTCIPQNLSTIPPPAPSLTPTVGCAPSYPWNHQSGRSSLRERLSSGAEAQNAWEKGQVRGAEATSGIRVTEVEASGMAHRQS